ncbi:MAG: ATPase, T2SS/T4P/T4SS family [Candidatus Aenigmatarchaeota archaeon]
MSTDYEYDENRMKVKINCMGYMYGASIEDFESTMSRVIDVILEVKKLNSVVLVKEREYEYGPDQIDYLLEIARIIEDAVRERIVSYTGGDKCNRFYSNWSPKIQHLAVDLMRRDPIGAYVELIREIRETKIKMSHANQNTYDCYKKYILEVLQPLKKKLDGTKMIKYAENRLVGHHSGDRTIYRELFAPIVRPNFMLTRYMIMPPKGGISVDRYQVGDTKVEIFKVPNSTEYFYHALPPEFRMSEEKYAVIDEARRYMASHKPRSAEFVRSKRIREVFYNIGKDIIKETADRMNISLTLRDLDQLASMLTRYTAGFGVLEVLLADEKIQDIYINSPIERQPIKIGHQDWEECKTNLIPTMEDAEAWATRLRIQSGRPLDESNPVLDTDLAVPGGSARFAVITKTLSAEGLGFAIRRHRDRPWTLPLFIKNRFVSPLASGLLSFLIDGSVSMLIAGGRSGGKTSLLASLMLEILPKTRILTIEDSVTGDCELLFERDGKLERGTVGDLIDEMIDNYGTTFAGRDISNINPENIKVFSISSDNKVNLSPVSKFIRHKVNKPIYEVETRTGRKIRVTGDHSLFTLASTGKIEPIKANKLRKGDHIVTPRLLSTNNKNVRTLNILDYLKPSTSAYISGEELKKVFTNRKLLLKLASKHEYPKITVGSWKRNNILPYSIFSDLLELEYEFDASKLLIKFSKNSKPISMILELNEDFLKFIGMWLADGCYDKNSVIISAQEKEIRDVVRNVAQMFDSKIRMHSDGFSSIINSNSLKFLMNKILELDGNAFSKRIPSWIFNLSKKQTGCVINGVISGDGCVSDKEIMLDVRSQNLVKDMQTLLLMFGIVCRTKERNGFYNCRISSLKSIRKFKEEIGVLPRKKAEKLVLLSSKVSTHDTTDVIPLPMATKIRLGSSIRGFNFNDYVNRDNNIGREHLGGLLGGQGDDFVVPEELSGLASSDIFWDEIREIKKIKSSGYVYDFSVPDNENFVCENILAHNTLELPVKQLIEMNYNIQSLKSRSVITKVETETPADEALRTALRLGDSALIIGEVRSTEAKALYEAMRIGALSNVVAGTIHGESAYGVFDRVVNDLGVPPTSFKATDIIPVCKNLRSADGLHKFRRVTEIAEVRKEWSGDPMKEGAFVNLMEYSSKDDQLKPTDTLLNGESEILNRIASYVKEWSGNWNSVWENIKLRGKIKQTITETAEKLNKPELLEAKWSVLSNQKFHTISETVKQEIGEASPTRIDEEWMAWFKGAIKGL